MRLGGAGDGGDSGSRAAALSQAASIPGCRGPLACAKSSVHPALGPKAMPHGHARVQRVSPMSGAKATPAPEATRLCIAA